TEHYHALVDMGSNGIRFSITDLSPPRARVLPTLFQDRCGVSLYDAQYRTGEKGPIPQTVIEEVLGALLRFKRIGEDFKVANERVRVVATEATRNAVNGKDFCHQIHARTGWNVELLAKEEEGRIGALGIASSFQSVNGLVMDLGGGSVQMTWMVTEDGEVKTSPRGSVSFPYGAAALTMQLDRAGTKGHGKLQEEISTSFESALLDIGIPSSLTKAADEEGGFTLFLSGGGFRGWGYILMSLHSVQPYPIPTINGFRVPKSSFLPSLEHHTDLESTFGISSRRASQVPAILLLIKALVKSIPSISDIYFAQGGVREGLLFSTLPPSVRSQHPLVTASAPFAPPSTRILVHLLSTAIPPPVAPDSHSHAHPPLSLTNPSFLTSTIHLLHAHSSSPKDIRSAAALRSTTTGLLADAHGLSHTDRALLALVLCERWGGNLSPADQGFFAGMQELVGPAASWWAKYIGRAAGGLGDLFAAGVVRE
ncbi:MAG: hypothetical protein Q9190_008087, partial [Brigantiaea leucoxantha]